MNEEIQKILTSLEAEIKRYEELSEKYYKLWSDHRSKARELTATSVYLKTYNNGGQDPAALDATSDENANENANENAARKKGLRQKGTTRDVFQIFSLATLGLSLEDAAKYCGCDDGKVKHVINRFWGFGFFAQDGDRYILTPAGMEFVKKSNPYKGSVSLTPPTPAAVDVPVEETVSPVSDEEAPAYKII